MCQKIDRTYPCIGYNTPGKVKHMEANALVLVVLGLVVIGFILAIFEIFSVSSTVKKILAQLEKSDRNRREEFEALSSGEE